MMKVRKLTLDESLFEELETVHNEIVDENDLSDSEDIEDIPSGPEAGSDTGIADLLISAINDEWTAIRGYNSIVATLNHETINNPIYRSFIDVINDIINEENKHVGQLQEILKQISPNVNSIKDGEVEGREQLDLTGGVLKVRSWDEERSSNVVQNNTTPNQIDTSCTICDVDDEM